MPSQFGGVASTTVTIFGGGLVPVTEGNGGGGLSMKTLALVDNVASAILTSTYGNHLIHIVCATSGAPQMSCFVGKTSPSADLVISDLHAVVSTTSDYLSLTWATDAGLSVILHGSTYSNESFKIYYT